MQALERLHAAWQAETHIGRKVRSQNRAIFDAKAKPAFEKRHGRSPQSPDEIGEAKVEGWIALPERESLGAVP